ncbi:MAG: glutamate--tRNA ligase [Clostridia bacterium]|nr:glutamate--tRNA ligase [Clostridia bacterium]
MKDIRVRFAPSPTGPLHIGGARSALFNFLLARKYGGSVILRIEDTDLERSSRESEKDIMDSLRWLGLSWDEGPDIGGPYGPYRQMERLDIYKKYVEKLFEKGYAYHCYCTEEELEQQRQELLAKGEMPRYTGVCYGLSEEERRKREEEGRKPVVRFRVPQDRIIEINDLVRGKVSFESSGIGDFIIVKSDGVPTYNFAVVVDDHEMGITHVIRAEEHLSNTPRQVLLYEALGLTPPEFAHISLILGKDRSKMSKRHGATSINQYRREGYLPEAMVNFLALLGWSPEGEEEVFSVDQLIERFSMDRVAKSPAVFDLEKLRWLNGVYIRNSDLERIAGLALPYLQEAGYASENPGPEEWERIKNVVEAVREYLGALSEITEHVRIFFETQFDFEDEKAAAVLREEQVPAVMEALKSKLAGVDSLDKEGAKKLLKEVSKEVKLKGRKVFMPIRVALTGMTHGPELHDIIPLLGAEEVIRRVEASMAKVRE